MTTMKCTCSDEQLVTLNAHAGGCPSVSPDAGTGIEDSRYEAPSAEEIAFMNMPPPVFPVRRHLRECVKVSWIARMVIWTGTRDAALAALKAIDDDDVQAFRDSLARLRPTKHEDIQCIKDALRAVEDC